MSDDRSDRLKKRRQRTSEKVEETTSDKGVKPDKQDKEDDEKPPVKERDDWGALQIQLPDDLRDELEISLDETNLGLKKEGEEKLEKLAHWYPLVVKAGVETIQEQDIGEIQDAVEQFE